MSVQEHLERAETESVTKDEHLSERLLNGGQIAEVAEAVAEKSTITNYTAPNSQISHGHTPEKHDVRASLDVTDEFVDAFFSDHGIAPNDHAALWLLSHRKNEAVSHEADIFSDVSDTNESRWQSIESAKEKAPIPAKTHSRLRP